MMWKCYLLLKAMGDFIGQLHFSSSEPVWAETQKWRSQTLQPQFAELASIRSKWARPSSWNTITQLQSIPVLMEFSLRYSALAALTTCCNMFYCLTSLVAHPLFMSHSYKYTEAMLLHFIWFIFLNIDYFLKCSENKHKKLYSILITNGKHKYSKLILYTYNNEWNPINSFRKKQVNLEAFLT